MHPLSCPDGVLQAPYYKLLTVSSHYNTQLGLLSALQAGADPNKRTQYLWQSKIPSLAAVLVFELHKAPSNELVVRAVFQDGVTTRYRALPLPCAVAGDAAEAFAGAGSCTLGNFRALAGPQAFNSSADWCDACSNNKVMACRMANMERQLVAVGVDPVAAAAGGAPVASRRQGVSPGMVALWCVVSVAAAALLAGVGLFAALIIKQRQNNRKKQQLAYAGGLDQDRQDPTATLSRTIPV